MTNTLSFPTELLFATNDERVKWFKEHAFIKHRRISEALDELRIAINEPLEGSIVNLFGPAGTGKTTVLRRAAKAVMKKALPTLDPGCIPFLVVVAAGPDRGMFDWMDFYGRALTALNEPLIEHKIRFNEDANKFERISLKGNDCRSLRLIYESTLRLRRVGHVGIDEAHNLATIARGRRLFDQTECVKSLGQSGEVQHILAGSYRLLDLAGLSGQVSRRSVNIHLSGYCADIEEDIQEFKDTVSSFQCLLPYPEEPDLVRHWEYLFVYCCGCVGTLKDWLVKAYKLSLDMPDRTLPLERLEKTALSKRDLDRLSREIAEGKMRLMEHEEPNAIELIKSRLGFNQKGGSVKAAGPPPPKNTSRRQRVGEPKLQRFPVGAEADGSD